MKHELKKKVKKNDGFSLVEVLVSLLIVSLTMTAIGRCITYSLTEYRKSVTRFYMVQEMENCRNSLLAKDFDSLDTGNGKYEKNGGRITLTWKVESLSSTLKRVKLSVSYGVLKRNIYFYKSRFINN